MAALSRPLLLGAQLPYCIAPERFWIPFKTFAADGGARPNSGGTPFRQPCPAYPPHKGEGAAGTFQRGKFPNSTSTRKRISLQLHCHFPRTPPQKTSSTQQAWMNSRNQTTIATCCKHRQHVFLHPIDECGRGVYFRVELASAFPVQPLAEGKEILRYAQDFGCGFAPSTGSGSRPQNASTC